MTRGDKPWPSGSPCPRCSALSTQFRQAEEALLAESLREAKQRKWRVEMGHERDAAIEQAKAAEGMLDEAVRLLGQAEEADGWTTPNEFLRRAAKVLTPRRGPDAAEGGQQ